MDNNLASTNGKMMLNTRTDKAAEPSRQSLNGKWQFRQVGTQEWLPATVPGCNFTDLLANELIADPFYRCEENNLQWIEQQDWEYKLEFNVEAELIGQPQVDLIMDGLDTYCDVMLNDNVILSSSNMFVGHRVDCKQQLKAGNNQLLVRFRSPIKEVYSQYLANGFTYPAENDKSEERLSVYTRKAPYHYGWDWGPRFVTSGIWRDIYIQASADCRIQDVAYQQLELNDNQAKLILNVKLNQASESNSRLSIQCAQLPELNVVSYFQTASNRIQVAIDIDNPQRWWPNGLGQAFLYQFSVTLITDNVQRDQAELEIGLRSIEVVNQPDEEGECFYIKVNGHPVFMKGANYIPSDSFLNRVDNNKYRQIFEDAVAANMNMLRVWGGGVYESDEFYRLADEYGILIWQDFMFACTLYPADESFLQDVQAEAKYNIKRLRNHPCIALWCGNNEVEMGIQDWQWPEKFAYSDELYERLKQDYAELFNTLLPSMVATYDPDRFYFPSSPIGFWEDPQDDKRGDNHYWGVWHGEEPFEEFRHRVPRFMSEYGFQSFPIMESVKQYSVEQDWHIESDVMGVHQKHGRGNQLIKQYMLQEYRQPKDFESFLYMSQVVQAQGMKIAFESHRLAMPFCMGTLYWQFNDCWPVASWSSIDYFGRWKAMHYQAKRSFEHKAVFIEQKQQDLIVSLVSDAPSADELDLELKLINFAGDILWGDTMSVGSVPNSCMLLSHLKINDLLQQYDQQQVVLVANLRSKDAALLSQALHYFDQTKALKLKPAKIAIASRILAGKIELKLSSDTLVRQLYLSIEGVVGNFSDNFFDLLPMTDKTISMPLPVGVELTEDTLRQKLTQMSIVDTY
ncbi:glycoside hydrolase family 2 protein [uncultured Paraglaciecola sp.]|uniref:beta-mannosidase n=1 Tax=uncultured Paraglaciecola sp. TaxID=1765024 RepID=UPI00261D2E23|nr:glycoside hydrolase family 2 protein [uncultured Paraglaciecola sp.]